MWSRLNLTGGAGVALAMLAVCLAYEVPVQALDLTIAPPLATADSAAPQLYKQDAVIDQPIEKDSITGLPPRPPFGPVRGISGDFWADVELGQRDFAEINERLIVPFKLKQPAGVAIDRSVSPGRIYVWDSGNNRILGMDLGTCYRGGAPCSATLVI